jgi:hypothetical protein
VLHNFWTHEIKWTKSDNEDYSEKTAETSQADVDFSRDCDFIHKTVAAIQLQQIPHYN